MRRFWLVVGIAAGMVGLLWLAEDEGVRRSLIELGGRSDDRGPSWGDVADKVGEFAREEAELKQVIGEDPDGAPPQ